MVFVLSMSENIVSAARMKVEKSWSFAENIKYASWQKATNAMMKMKMKDTRLPEA